MKQQLILLFFFMLFAPTICMAQSKSLPAGKSGHGDFKAFWKDFKKAVNADDKEAVAALTYFTFKDTRDFGQGIGKGPNNLTCNTKAEFMNKYDMIFSPALIAAINKDGYTPCNGAEFPDPPKIKPRCYELMCPGGGIWLDFFKIEGVYMLTGIPYKE